MDNELGGGANTCTRLCVKQLTQEDARGQKRHGAALGGCEECQTLVLPTNTKVLPLSIICMGALGSRAVLGRFRETDKEHLPRADLGEAGFSSRPAQPGEYWLVPVHGKASFMLMSAVSYVCSSIMSEKTMYTPGFKGGYCKKCKPSADSAAFPQTLSL